MLTVHGTRAQFYTGSADWTAIRGGEPAGRPPLVANGDIVDADSARAALAASGADAVMIGRGAQGAPWRLAQISHQLYGTPAPVVPDALADLVAGHYEDMMSFYGMIRACASRARSAGTTEATGAAGRELLFRAPSPAETLRLIRSIPADAPGPNEVAACHLSSPSPPVPALTRCRSCRG